MIFLRLNDLTLLGFNNVDQCIALSILLQSIAYIRYRVYYFFFYRVS